MYIDIGVTVISTLTQLSAIFNVGNGCLVECDSHDLEQKQFLLRFVEHDPKIRANVFKRVFPSGNSHLGDYLCMCLRFFLYFSTNSLHRWVCAQMVLKSTHGF